MSSPPKSGAPFRAWLLLAVAGATWIALGRAVLYALDRGYFAGEFAARLPSILALRTVDTLALALLLFLGMGVAAMLLRRNRFAPLALPPLAGLYAFLAWGHLTMRLPVEQYGYPGFGSARGIAANAIAAGCALLLATLLFLPLLAPAGALGKRFVGALLTLSRLTRVSGLALLVIVVGLWALPRGGADDERPNLILISIDTLRADHVGAYGYEGGTTPNLDRFAAEAVRFDSAFSHHPWTLTAHATMLTGLHPSAHRVDRDRALSPRVPTLAGLLQDEGYATLGVADENEWLNERYGFARGFQDYRQIEGGADLKVQQILDGLEDWAHSPFFLFAHFYDVHSDWEQLPYESELADRLRHAGWYEGDFDGCDGERGCASRLLATMNETGERLEEDELRYLESLYDAGISTFDRQLGVLLEGLEAAGRFDDSIILITADHGEEFFEHGKALHGQHYDECLSVPFLLRLPGGRFGGTSLDDLVALVDITPTLLEAAGLDPAEVLPGTQGRSVLPLARGEQTDPRLGVLLDTGNGVFGLRTPGYSVLHGARDWELYDVVRDPGQTQSLFEGTPDEDVALRLRLLLKDMREATLSFGALYDDGAPLEDIDQAAADQMAALGYLEGEEEPREVRDLDAILAE